MINDKQVKISKAKIKNGMINIVETKIINPTRCPNFILSGEHYKQNSCDCFNQEAKIMKDWGYKWDKIKGCWV